MKKEAQELGFAPWGDSAQEEYERWVTDLEQHALENPEDDLEILFYVQEGFSWKANVSLSTGEHTTDSWPQLHKKKEPRQKPRFY